MSHYKDNNGILYNCDCLELLRKLPNNKIDCTITSPPYDFIREYKGFKFNFEEIAKELYRVTKDGGIVVWIVNDQTVNGSETGTSFRQALFFKDACGFNLHDTMIYKKNSLTFPETNRYYPCWEYMFILSKGKPKTINLIADRQNKQSGKTITGNYRDTDGSLKKMSGSKKKRPIKDIGVRFNIWEYNTGWQHSYKEEYLKGHPAIFPEQLVIDHIISWTNKDDIILDPFMGSGTTAVAAIELGRKWVGCEISKEYCDIIIRRVNDRLIKQGGNRVDSKATCINNEP